MAIIDSINQARQKGASDDQIVSEILRQNPSKATSFQEAQKRGANSTLILNEIIKQNTQAKQPVSFGQKLLNAGTAVTNFLGGRGVQETFGAELAKLGARPEDRQYITQPTLKETAGSAIQLGSTFLPVGAGAKGIATGAKALGLGTKAAQVAGNIGAGVATGAVIGVGQAMQENQDLEQGIGTVAKRAATGGVIPVAAAGVSGLKNLFGKGIETAGEKIQTVVLKPNRVDLQDGFDVKNLSKYKLGGSLEQTLAKTNQKFNELGIQLESRLKNSYIPVNLNDVFEETTKSLAGNKAVNFGNNAGLTRTLNSLKSEIETVSGPNGLVDLLEANSVKRAAGTKGSWVFGNPDPDAVATEKVYNAFYNKLKVAIEQAAEKSGQGGIKEINKQLSELIPIQNAVIRRIPIAERNNILSLTDIISVTGAVIDPRSLAITGINRLSKSGRVGDILARAGRKLQGKAYDFTSPGDMFLKTGTGQKLQSEVSDYIKDPKLGASVKAVTLDDFDVKTLKKIRDAYREQGSYKLRANQTTVSIPSGTKYTTEQDILKQFGINPNQPLSKIADKIDELLQKFSPKTKINGKIINDEDIQSYIESLYNE